MSKCKYPSIVFEVKERLLCLLFLSNSVKFIKWPANKYYPFISGGWILVPNETPNQDLQSFDLSSKPCLISDQTLAF